jgi:sulfofructose kinase
VNEGKKRPEILVIGHPYIDHILITPTFPQGNEKVLLTDCVVSYGGNAVTAGFFCALHNVETHLICPVGTDPHGTVFTDWIRKAGIKLYPRWAKKSSLSFIHPNQKGERAIARFRDATYENGFHEHLDVSGFAAVHIDGHQHQAALHYARLAQERGILVSFDGGTYRGEQTEELLPHIRVGVVSELFCQQMGKTPMETLRHLEKSGCEVGAVTLGERGTLWYQGSAHPDDIHCLRALYVPVEKVLDANGAGDIFHGAYLFSYVTWPNRNWNFHLRFARAAAAHAVQHIGNEASIPTLEQIDKATELNESPMGPPRY